MRSERKCSIFDLLWPDPSIPEGESEKFVFLENNNIFERKKIIHSLSCLTRVYLCAEIETIWIFDPCQKNFIFVWFLHGCPLKLKKKKNWGLCISLSFISIVFAHENNWLCPGIFSSREICRKPTGQHTAGSFLINFTSHAIKRRRHSIERDVDLHVVIEKKQCRYFSIEASE